PAWLKIERISAVLSEPPTDALPPGRGLAAFGCAGVVAAKAFGAAPTFGVIPLCELGCATLEGVVNVGAPPGRAGLGATPGIAWLADGRTVCAGCAVSDGLPCQLLVTSRAELELIGAAPPPSAGSPGRPEPRGARSPESVA